MIVWLAVAHAEPVALRTSSPGAVVLGLGSLSAAAPVGPVSLGAELSTDLGAVGVALGDRLDLVGAEGGGWLGVGGSVSLLVLPYGPGLGAGLTPWVSAGTRGRTGALVASFAAPVELGTGGTGALRLPLLAGFEASLGLRPGWRLGATGHAGPVVTPGLDTSAVADLGLLLGFGQPPQASQTSSR